VLISDARKKKADVELPFPAALRGQVEAEEAPVEEEAAAGEAAPEETAPEEAPAEEAAPKDDNDDAGSGDDSGTKE
jgi:hypothetical protein